MPIVDVVTHEYHTGIIKTGICKKEPLKETVSRGFIRGYEVLKRANGFVRKRM